MKPIFHIGYHKTATTWFQSRFYPFVEADVVERSTIHDTFLRPPGLEFDPKAARLRIRGNIESQVFCDEELSGNPHNGGLNGLLSEAVANRIADAFPEAKVVIFIRNQFSMARSVYKQYVKMGGTWSAERYFLPGRFRAAMNVAPNRNPTLRPGHLSYSKLVGKYVELLGRPNVYVYLYESFVTDPLRFLEGMCQDLGLNTKCPLDSLDFSSTNQSFSSYSLQIVRLLNHFYDGTLPNKHHFATIPRWRAVVNRVGRALSVAASTRPPRSNPIRIPTDFIEIWAKSNEQLENQFGIPVRQHGYPFPE